MRRTGAAAGERQGRDRVGIARVAQHDQALPVQVARAPRRKVGRCATSAISGSASKPPNRQEQLQRRRVDGARRGEIGQQRVERVGDSTVVREPAPR